MRLYASQHSPFARKVRIVVAALGLDARVETLFSESGPLDDPGPRAKNPLKKIPFLEMADGQAVLDSRVAAEALIAAAEDRSAVAALLPETGPERLDVLTRQALVDGLCDAAVSIAYERRLRPAELQWPEWLDNQWMRVVAGLDWLEAHPAPEGRFDLGDCAVAGALPYLDYRFADRDWREGRPNLAAWWETARQRTAVAATLSA